MHMLTVFAAEAGAATGMVTEAMKTAYTTALNGISADVFDMMAVALPIGLGIAGVFMAIRLGIRFFHSVAN